MDSLIAGFAEVVREPYKYLSQWKKKTGKKIIGCFPMYVPEEIVHAGGMLPVIVMDSQDPIAQADRYMMTCTCHLVRSTFDLALRDKMSFLDGLIFPDICEPVQLVADVWRVHRPAPFHYNLVVPLNLESPLGKKYLMTQYQTLRTALEKFAGRSISDQAIRESITVYNRNRALLRQLYDIRRKNPEAIGVKELGAVVAAGMLMPKEEHSRMLEKLLPILTKRAVPASNGKARLVLAGDLCDRPEIEILGLIDELEAVVVDDDLYCGSRYFATPADEKLPPIEALAERYVNDVPCPSKHNPRRDLGDYLVNMVKVAEADALVMLTLKYCEPLAHDYPYLKEKLTEAGIPHLLIETDHGPIPLGQIRTRLQALLELVGR